MIELRDGTEVKDQRLGLLTQTDPRNDLYTVAGTTQTTSDVVWELPAVLDQGDNGACVGYAFTHALHAQGWNHPNINATFAWNIYTSAQRIDPWPGGQYPNANPQMIGTSLLAVAKVLHRTNFAPSYHWANTVTQIRAGLETGPGVLGCMWRNSMNTIDSDTHIVEVKGRKTGGHALAVTGKIGDMFVVANSWGAGWGGQGLAFITETDMTKLLRDRVGQVVFPARHRSVAL